MKLTTIIACKNRDVNIKYCIESIKSCNPRPNVYLVDFGNDIPIREIFPNYKWVRVIRVVNRTEMFHKARALNIAIRRVKTPYICITDADQIFAPNFFGVVENTLTQIKNAYVKCKTYALPTLPSKFGIAPEDVGNNYVKLLAIARKNKPCFGDGCCHGVTSKWINSVGGYEEGFMGWGFEDSDLSWRAHLCKLLLRNINKYTSMIHLPHRYVHKQVVRREKNKMLYHKRRKAGIIKANSNRAWGRL